MEQTRLASLTEATVNTASGFILSMVLWQLVVAPLFGYEVTIGENFVLTSIFTVVSVGRSYAWRRFFARKIYLGVIRLFKR